MVLSIRRMLIWLWTANCSYCRLHTYDVTFTQSCCPRGLALASMILEDTIWRSWSWPRMARSWPWIEAKANIFLELEKSPEHFQIKDADFMWCYRTIYVQRQMSARLLIIFKSPLSACHSQQVRTLKNHNKLKSHKS